MPTFKIILKGIVEGVGMRPAILRYANGCKVAGFVCNHADFVEIILQGSAENCRRFIEHLPENFPPEELFWCFPEMRNVGECRFRGCSHISEPDCAVKKKLSEGGISPSRYESYCALYSALKEHKDWE